MTKVAGSVTESCSVVLNSDRWALGPTPCGMSTRPTGAWASRPPSETRLPPPSVPPPVLGPSPIGGLTLLVCLAPLQDLPFAGLLPLPSLPALLLELGRMLLFCPGSRFHP